MDGLSRYNGPPHIYWTRHIDSMPKKRALDLACGRVSLYFCGRTRELMFGPISLGPLEG